MPRSILLVLVFLLTAVPAFAEVPLEIGPDTTVIDGPINPDGTINYLAYLNEKLSEGVTPENNFAVDVALTMGEDAWPSEALREKVMKGLGIKMPADGPFFVRFPLFLGGKDVKRTPDGRGWDRVYDASEGPWTAEQYPEVKHWLNEQDQALDRIVESVNQKDRYYFPLVVSEENPEAIEMALLPWLSQLRSIARSLKARAEWNIAAGELDNAWSDVQAMHRMANHTMRESHIVSWLVGVSIHNMALSVVDDVLSSDRLTARFAKRAIADSRSTAILPDIVVQLDVGSRLGSLDALLHCWKGRGGVFELSEPTYSLMAKDGFDPNVTLGESNRQMDRLIEAAGIPDPRLRIQAMDQIDKEIGELYLHAIAMLGGDVKAIAAIRNQMLEGNVYTVAATYLFLGQTFVRPAPVVRVQVAAQMRLQLQPVALAIGGYHAEHGDYPPNLNALAPEYLDSLPIDFATGELPVYRVEDGAAVVYSLGTDLEDDGGADGHPDGDIVFRIER